jgi:putative ABC transport system substrate-binding protein
MKRRTIIAAMGATAATWPTVVRAQQANRPPGLRIGVAFDMSSKMGTVEGVLFQRLSDLGFVDGRNLVIDYDLSPVSNLDATYADMVRRNADILLALGPEHVLKSARRAAAGRIPVVFIAMDYDPLRLGHVESLARPGGNVTGLFVRQAELGVKRLEIARDALPAAGRVALWWDANVARDQFEASSAAAASRGFDLRSVEVGSASYNFADAMRRTKEIGADAIILASSGAYFDHSGLIAQSALAHRLPLIAFAREFVELGALLSYGINVADTWRHVASYVARIAKGAKPSELPVEQPTKFELAVNLRTAASLGLNLSPTLLARADEVFE